MSVRTSNDKKKSQSVTRRPSNLPELPSSLSVAFSHLEGGWRSYIRFVRIAATSNDKEMQKLSDYHAALPWAKRRSITPEDLCQGAGVTLLNFIGSVMPWIWTYSNAAAAVIAATSNPAVIARTAKSAMGKGKFAHKDRETFLKVTGALPTARGTTINNMPIASASAGSVSGLVARLPSAGHDIMEIESSELDESDDS